MFSNSHLLQRRQKASVWGKGLMLLVSRGFPFLCLADFFKVVKVSQSVTTQAVNPEVVSLNPVSANIIFRTFNKTQCYKHHSPSTNGQTVYVEKQPVALKDCCVEYWCEKGRKQMDRWTGRCDMNERLLKSVLNQ